MPIQTDGKFDQAMDKIAAFPMLGWIIYIPVMIITGPFRHSWKNALVGIAILAAAGYSVWAFEMPTAANAGILAAAAVIAGSIWYPGENSYIDTVLNGEK